MERNLDRRVEVLFPVLDPQLAHFVRETLLATYLADNMRARLLIPDGSYQRLRPGLHATCDSQLPVQMIPDRT
jgi:polyphosphate kinase